MLLCTEWTSYKHRKARIARVTTNARKVYFYTQLVAFTINNVLQCVGEVAKSHVQTTTCFCSVVGRVSFCSDICVFNSVELPLALGMIHVLLESSS